MHKLEAEIMQTAISWKKHRKPTILQQIVNLT